jgi:hypothetical protein
MGFWPISFSCICARGSKKSPALTIAQARELIARALEEEQDERADILSIITYQQKRNYAAYLSHRRRHQRKA